METSGDQETLGRTEEASHSSPSLGTDMSFSFKQRTEGTGSRGLVHHPALLKATLLPQLYF